MICDLELKRRDGSPSLFAWVDDHDRDRTAPYHWCLSGDGRYVVGRVDGKLTLLHRYLLNLNSGDGQVVDHINGNGLDNRRSNLRVGTQVMNGQNSRVPPGKTSPHRGVCWDRTRGKWTAQAQMRGRHFNLGRFETEEEAAQAARTFRERNAWAFGAAA